MKKEVQENEQEVKEKVQDGTPQTPNCGEKPTHSGGDGQGEWVCNWSTNKWEWHPSA